MRNAPVAALLYEMLFDIYRDMAGTRAHNQWFPDENGTMREAFYHYHSTYWEWSTEMLLAVGAIKASWIHPSWKGTAKIAPGGTVHTAIR